MKIKISRNDPCPCRTGLKYKHCCEGKIDWESILRKGDNSYIEYLSARGKNLTFIENIAGILQLDNIKEYSYEKFKKAFTPNAVRSIYELIPQLWPNYNDLERILKLESNSLSGLYIGNYTPATITNGIRRHSLYNEKILLIDPFQDPRNIVPKFNPINHPELHIENAINAVRILFSTTEWIANSFISFIKTPGDFDAKLELDCMNYEYQKFKEHPDLIHNPSLPEEYDSEIKEHHFIAQTDQYIIKMAKEANPEITPAEIEGILNYVKERRKDHPFYVPLVDENNKPARGSLMVFSSGTNYEMAKIIVSITNSSFITDLPSRWKEIELDHSQLKIEQNEWTSFIKAFHSLDFKFFDNIDLNFVLKVRKENRLKNLRSFLSRLWRKSVSGDKYSEENVKILKEELEHHFREAEYEWKNINNDLLKWIRTETLGLGATAPSLISQGRGYLLVGGILISSAITAVVDWSKRHNFKLKYPTSFMLDLIRKEET